MSTCVNIWRKTERMPSILLIPVISAVLYSQAFFYSCTLLHFVSWDILENAFSPALSVPLSHLKTLEQGDRNYQSAVYKVLSSSQNVLRSCFYILLLSHGHKSFGRMQRHLLHSLHLTASPPLLRLEAVAAEVCSSLLSGNCSFLWCHSVSFIQILHHHYNSTWTSSHDCPLSATKIHLTWVQVGQLFSELPEDGAIPQKQLFQTFYSTFF